MIKQRIKLYFLKRQCAKLHTEFWQIIHAYQAHFGKLNMPALAVICGLTNKQVNACLDGESLIPNHYEHMIRRLEKSIKYESKIR